MKLQNFIVLSLSLAIISSCGVKPSDVQTTRGIGVYPGDSDEYFGPVKSQDNSYRNLALHKAVHHSSSYDYNLTGELATDGIIAESTPYYIDMASQDGSVAKREREKVFDDNMTAFTVKGGKDAYLTFSLYNGSIDADELEITGSAACEPDAVQGYDIVMEATSDGENWTILKEFKGNGLPGEKRAQRRGPGIRPGGPGGPTPGGQPAGGGSQNVAVSAGLGRPQDGGAPQMTLEMMERMRKMEMSRNIRFKAEIPASNDFTAYRIKLMSEAVSEWTFQEMNFSKNGKETKVIPSYGFYSTWMSEGNTDEWIYVDFGASAYFDKIKLHWISKPEGGIVEVSDNAGNWTKLADLPGGDKLSDELSVKGKGRYVRLSGLSVAEGSHIMLSEMEIWGHGGVTYTEHPQLQPKGNRLYLSGGKWRLQRSSEVEATGEEIASEGFSTDKWIIATVPATVASSYYNVGAIPDIRYDDDQLQISESFFYSDFWYRDEFDIPTEFEGKEIILNFDGINWKSDIYFNGNYVGHIDGAFTRSHFDVTELVNKGTNYLAVKIIKNDNPGIIKEQNRITADTNGGVLGADNPTMHCSIGWDWIPTVRGRNIGIWNDVWIGAHEGGVTIDDVYTETDLPLPSTEYADIKPVITVTNHSEEAKNTAVKVSFGDLILTSEVTLAAGETKDVEMIPSRLANPILWWPAGYGDQYLYDVTTTVTVDNAVSDTKYQKSGIREMSYTTDGGILDLYVNGRRLICNGGNWGFPEINLNYRGREYDIAVAYHADMNYTMIRDWVGQTGDEEFYEACDRHGVMVWQDFWLANPSDGPDPDDNTMFMANAEDYVRKIRNHPSIAIYVGRNEGNPPEELNTALAQLVERMHPGMYYIPHSAAGMVSGNGPYRALPVEEYFLAERGKDRLHSERGMPNVMTYESMTRMLREENWWPQTSVWGVHDYTMENAQSCATFNELISNAFGEPQNLKEFTSLAQWINYNGYRAMYESRSWNRKGLLIWMSHSCWPSMVWQTYDYYFEPTAAYFGVKKASAPIRIQWNPVSGNVEVVNNNASDQTGLTAYAALINYDGEVVNEQFVELDSFEDTTTPLFQLTFDNPQLADVYYIKLKLTKNGNVIADNFYWESKDRGNWKLLRTLPEVKPSFKCKMSSVDGQWKCTATIKNNSSTPALMIRLKAQSKKGGESIVPAFYQDNWFSLLPGEEKVVEITFKDEDAHGQMPAIVMEGFNIRTTDRK